MCIEDCAQVADGVKEDPQQQNAPRYLTSTEKDLTRVGVGVQGAGFRVERLWSKRSGADLGAGGSTGHGGDQRSGFKVRGSSPERFWRMAQEDSGRETLGGQLSEDLGGERGRGNRERGRGG